MNKNKKILFSLLTGATLTTSLIATPSIVSCSKNSSNSNPSDSNIHDHNTIINDKNLRPIRPEKTNETYTFNEALDLANKFLDENFNEQSIANGIRSYILNSFVNRLRLRVPDPSIISLNHNLIVKVNIKDLDLKNKTFKLSMIFDNKLFYHIKDSDLPAEGIVGEYEITNSLTGYIDTGWSIDLKLVPSIVYSEDTNSYYFQYWLVNATDEKLNNPYPNGVNNIKLNGSVKSPTHPNLPNVNQSVNLEYKNFKDFLTCNLFYPNKNKYDTNNKILSPYFGHFEDSNNFPLNALALVFNNQKSFNISDAEQHKLNLNLSYRDHNNSNFIRFGHPFLDGRYGF